MKSQLDLVLEGVCAAITLFEQSFNKESFDKEPRLMVILSLLRETYRIPPKHSLYGLIIEYDRETGVPKINDEAAQRYINLKIEKALAEVEPNVELDLLDADRDGELIARMRTKDRASEARFILQGRLEGYRELVTSIENALRETA